MSSRSDSLSELPRLRGKIQRLYSERGFGFIREQDSGEDYFFHVSGLDRTFGEIEEGLTVEFEWRLTAKGKRAEHIQRAL